MIAGPEKMSHPKCVGGTWVKLTDNVQETVVKSDANEPESERGNDQPKVENTQNESAEDSTNQIRNCSNEFWDFMRRCVQKKLMPIYQKFDGDRYFKLGDRVISCKAVTNLSCIDSNGYHDVGSIMFMCYILTKRMPYEKYCMKASKKKSLNVIEEHIYHKVKPYLFGESNTLPEVINKSVVMDENIVFVNSKADETCQSEEPTSASTDVTDRTKVYAHFFIRWIKYTKLKFRKRITKLKWQSEWIAGDGTRCKVYKKVNITIETLPKSHISGTGYGINNKKAFYAATREIVKRLYHAGLVTAVLYEKIENASISSAESYKMATDWQNVIDCVTYFKQQLQTQNIGSNPTSVDKIIEEVKQSMLRSESKLNSLVRRKRKFIDSSEAETLVRKKACAMKEEEEKKSLEIVLSDDDAIGSDNMLSRDSSVQLLDDDDGNEIVIINESTRQSSSDDVAPQLPQSVVNELDINCMESAGVSASCSNLNPNEDIYSILPCSQHQSFNASKVAQIDLDSKYKELCAKLGVQYVEKALLFQQFIRKRKEANEKAFDEFSEHIWQHFTINGQDDRTFSWKMRAREKLVNLMTKVYRQASLTTVGSTVNGCGSYNSDMDLCFCLPDASGIYNPERSYAVFVLRKLYRSFIGPWRKVIRHLQYIPATVPILKLEMASPFDELEIDINCNNLAGVYNSHLLHYYSRVDDRFPALCLLVKHWAINSGINDAMTGTLNSYSLILMVLHFLQCAVMPPVLPNLQKLYPSVFNGNCPVENLALFQPLALPEREINSDTVGELLISFFNYYATFDFISTGISIRNGGVFDRHPGTARFLIFIEEPYDMKNTARCVTKRDKFMRIVNQFIHARNALLDTCEPSLSIINVS